MSPLKPDYFIDHNGLPNILNQQNGTRHRQQLSKSSTAQNQQFTKAAKDRMNQQIAAASKDRASALSNHCANKITQSDKKNESTSCGCNHIESKSSNSSRRYKKIVKTFYDYEFTVILYTPRSGDFVYNEI